jgi:multiple sugar transport system substrate-binding protein
MGREGELVQELVAIFEKDNPGIEVDVQQIPWSAAHEKLLTAFVGRATPDLAQLGNTWIAEFAALGALEELDSHIATTPGIAPHDYFEGIWRTNVIDGVTWGVPWYVDTRLLFYRKDVLAQAGFDSMPGDWAGWIKAMEAVRNSVGPDRYAIFLPLNEWTQAVIFGLQEGSPLLVDDFTRGAFSAPRFRDAFHFYYDIFERGLAPPVGNNEIANLYQEFAKGLFAMYITGPWNLSEFQHRLPEELQDAWGTAPLPGPLPGHPGVSLAGGASLVVFKRSRHGDAAWKLVEFLSRPENQLRFYELSGDLPAKLEAWKDGGLAEGEKTRAFWIQLHRAVPLPAVPEWELIAVRVQEYAEKAIRGVTEPDSALVELDREVDRILQKRRWLRNRPGTSSPHALQGR